MILIRCYYIVSNFLPQSFSRQIFSGQFLRHVFAAKVLPLNFNHFKPKPELVVAYNYSLLAVDFVNVNTLILMSDKGLALYKQTILDR